MLSSEEVMKNKERFIELVNGIEREGVDKEHLIKKLESSDFFSAPASTKYHNAFEGGLCAHCLSVYDTLKKFVESLYGDESETDSNNRTYGEDTIRIVSLFHDFDKMNKYEKSVRNMKVYTEKGSKYDELGKFDWVSVPSYKVKEYCDIFTIGTHGENSVYMTETFIPLTAEEHCAILNHHGIYDNPKLDTSSVFHRYPLSLLLHMADMVSALALEENEQDNKRAT